MSLPTQQKFQSTAELWQHLPEEERIIADVLRQIILETLPKTCREKISYNVPCWFGKKWIAILWPASVKGGGVKKGVLLGFAQGYKLKDKDNYLTHGTNKRIFYKIFLSPEEIDEHAIVALLKEAVEVDNK